VHQESIGSNRDLVSCSATDAGHDNESVITCIPCLYPESLIEIGEICGVLNADEREPDGKDQETVGKFTNEIVGRKYQFSRY
jgi:hypothetical protein